MIGLQLARVGTRSVRERSNTPLSAVSVASVSERFLAVLLAVALVVSLVPGIAWAQPGGAHVSVAEERALAGSGESSEGGSTGPMDSLGSADRTETLSNAEAGEPFEIGGGSTVDRGLAGDAVPSENALSNEDGSIQPSALDSLEETASSDSSEPSSSRAVSNVDGVRVKTTSGMNLPSKLGAGLEIKAWAFVEEEDPWGWGTEEVEVSDYAGISFQWYRGGTQVSYAPNALSYKNYAPIDGANARTYLLADADAGSFLAVKVTLANGVEKWSSSSTPKVTDGKADLASVEIEGTAKQGNALTAIAHDAASGTAVESGVAYRWLVGDAVDGEFHELPGARGSSLELTSSEVGKYVKVEASSRNEVVSPAVGAVVAAGSAENEARVAAAITALEKDGLRGYYPNPKYGTDSNLNRMIESRLSELGFDGVSTRVSAAAFSGVDPKQQGSVDVSEGSDNGAITYFFLAPDAKTVSFDYSVLRQFKPTYALTFGDATGFYTPSRASSLAWDDARVLAYLEGQAANVSLDEGIKTGSIPASALKVGLPTEVRAGSAKTATIGWSSSDSAVAKIANGFDSDYNQTATAVFSHTAVPRSVTLTATYELQVPGYGSGPGVSYRTTFDMVVEQKSGAEVDDIKKQLANVLKRAKVVDAASGGSVQTSAVDGDVKFSTPRSLGVDGKVYKLSYVSSDEDFLKVNGYRGVVTRSLEGEPIRTVEVSASLTYDGVTVSRELGAYTLKPVSSDELEQAVRFMNDAAAAYGQALLGQNASADQVTVDLDAFMEVSRAADGSLAWARSVDQMTDQGVVPDDIPGYDPMGSQKWRTFRSSDAGVLEDEILRVNRPDYDRRVAVDSVLTYKAYESLAAAHPENRDLQSLVKRPVQAEFTVAGTKGQTDPFVTATCSIIGVDKHGNRQTWAAAEPFTLDNGSKASGLTEALLAKTGISANIDRKWGWYLESVTSPYDAGQTLGWDEATGRFWQLFVNGSPVTIGANDWTLQPGDRVAWCYSASGEEAPSDRLSATCSVIGIDADGAVQTWVADVAYAMPEGSTASNLSDRLFADAGLKVKVDASHGWYLSEISSPYDGRALGWDEATGRFWQLFVNGSPATVGAGGYELHAGDQVAWFYSADRDVLPGRVAAACEVVGMDIAGNPQVWASSTRYAMVEGATAADLTDQLFARTGLKATVDTERGWYLKDLTSPFDGRALGWDQGTGKYWQLFVNGRAALVGANGLKIDPDDKIVWYYSARGSSLPAPGDVVVNPDAPRPGYDSSWPQFGSGSAIVNVATPAESADLLWSFDYKAATSSEGVSDPLIVNGLMYVVSGGSLMKIDVATGKVTASASVGGANRYFCRPAYAGGVIIVPTDDGRLAAFTADALTCVWRTEALDTKGGKISYQALSTLTVNGDYAYAGFTQPGGANSTGTAGALACVRISDGRVMWVNEGDSSNSGKPEGYYWAGAAASGSDIVIGDESGAVVLIEGDTGKVKSSVSLGAPCRSTIVSAGDGRTLLAVTSDGVLHKIVREGDALSVAGRVSFARSSTSTPIVSNGTVFVCGADADGYGTLSLIDLAGMRVDRTVVGGLGAAQGSPLVSVQGDGTYAYFTCNGLPGGVYAYRVGDAAAYALYTPAGPQQNYCTASVIADEEGNLYYTNDAGVLFALKGRAGFRVTFDSTGGSFVPSAMAVEDKPIVQPADPSRDGYSFGGWFVDSACTRAWDFETPVDGDMTLYARWVANARPGGVGESGSGPNGTSGSFRASFGAPGAAHAPLMRQASGKADGQAGKVAEGTSSLNGASGSGSARVAEPNGEDAAGAARNGVNPWAAGGLMLGMVGLVGAVAYGAVARRRTKGDGNA
ncbi:DUF4430 domain-containing protein [Paraeggerthella sp. LCP19S3_G8]|uniref:DUF4430 domain-containing protein n=1 Tax=Paraeggerthella sp. LCP19S3_G8 TaxID=3440248 RepID=UPI003F965E8C